MKLSVPDITITKRAVRPIALLVGSAAILAACGADGEPVPLQLSVDSSDAQWVSGGDALLRVKSAFLSGRSLRLSINGSAAAANWATDPNDASSRIAVVSGLSVGQNNVTAELVEDRLTVGKATLQIQNYPRTGPMFSGPQEAPFVCQTATFRVYTGGPLLGDAKDSNCSIDTRVDYVYRSTAGSFSALPSTSAVPADAATATTTDGRTVPYIVRIETGTVNRAIYQTALLHNPVGEVAPSPTAKPSGWNGRVIYTFGGGCPGGWYRQGASTGGVLDHALLSQGYAMASSSLNVYGNNCNDVIAAESVAMVRERFSEVYGRPRHVIGWGCSGGSYQQIQTADNYPGLLDGIIPGCSFPEVMFATTHFMTDARLLGHYFRDTAPGLFTEAQQAAVAGVVTIRTVFNPQTYNGGARIGPFGCDSTLPVALRYDPVTNPAGTRCSMYDHTANALGRDPATGFARQPWDNVGIQYGLDALNRGLITVDQFLDLNERLGGYDMDGNFATARKVGDTLGMRAAYRGGRMTHGGGGLKTTPIIDYRAYDDDKANGDVHTRYHSFSMRERLVKANGNADNYVMLHEADRLNNHYTSASPLLLRAVAEMDKWLTAIARDDAAGTASEKLVRNKPATLQEGCNSRDATPVFIAEKMERTSGQCAALYPAPAGPRGVAGSGIASDVIKCQLKPVLLADYAVTFTAEQEARLRSIFPGGVCNWSLAGVEQQALAGTWQRY